MHKLHVMPLRYDTTLALLFVMFKPPLNKLPPVNSVDSCVIDSNASGSVVSALLCR